LSGVSIGSRADQEDMIRAIEVNGIQPVIDRTFPLEQLAAAFEYNQSQRRLGKVGIEIAS
jgi:NADPH:quinone reductase-like Zn-dependent oxidoreductase